MKNAYVLVTLLVVLTVSAMGMPKPKVFVKNDGRWPADVLYSAAAPNAMLWITTKGMIVDMRVKDSDGHTRSTNVRYDVVGSVGSNAVSTQTDFDAPTVSILTANRNCSALKTASSVVVRDVLPGIHLEYVWEGDNVRYNVHADAGVTPPSPLFAVDGATDVFATRDGITSATPLGRVTMSDIVSYQSHVSTTKPTTWNTTVNTIGFDVANRDMHRALTIDPIVRVLSISGNADEEITVVKRRSDGMYVVGGWTTSTSFGGALGSLTLPNRGAGEDGFIAIVSADMQTVLHWAYIAGAGNERVRDLAINATGQIIVVGETNSADFPVKGSILGQARGGAKDGFVVVLSPDLSQQVRGLFIAGNKDDIASGVAIDSEGRIVIVGTTSSDVGITTYQGYDPSQNGGTDGFIYIMNSNFLNIDSFTYFGGSGNDSFAKVVIDGNNNAVICGATQSQDFVTFPVKILVPDSGGGGGKGDDGGGEGTYKEIGNNAYNHIYNGGASDVVVVKFTSIGDLAYSTYFGGNGADDATGLFIDTEDAAFIVGNTSSSNLPVENSTTTYMGRYDGFVASISSDGLRSSGASYIGGSGDDYITSVTQYQPGIGMLVGRTTSPDFQSLGVGSMSAGGTKSKAFLARMSVNEIKWASVLGMDGDVQPLSVVKDQYNDAIIGGRIVNATLEGGMAGSTDGFISKWAFGTLSYKSPMPGDALCAGKAVTVRWLADGIDMQQPNSVDFSVDNGLTWDEVGTNIKAREYKFTVPNDLPSSAQSLFRIRALRGQEVATPTALNVFTLPIIMEQPVAVAPCPSSSVTLSVEVEGADATYQWRKNGAAISGATTAAYIIPSVQTSDGGSYDVVITNACLTINSNAVAVVVTDKPIIDEQPPSRTVNAGETVTLSVTVRGWDLVYKWQLNGVDVPGANQRTLTLNSISQTDVGSYTCVIGSACGSTTSDAAQVALNGTTGVDDEAAMFVGVITLRPQPATDVVTVGVPPLTSNAFLVMRNMQGIEVLRTNLLPNADAQTVNVSTTTMPSGTYHVQLLGRFGSYTSLLSVMR